MSDKEKDVLRHEKGWLRIERHLNEHRPMHKQKTLTVEELEKIAKAQGVKRYIVKR